jgi:hypothetical protein
MKQQITEEQNVHKEWYEQSNTQTLETLPEFLRHLTEDYSHDYGTICHAITAGAIATANAINKSPEGGITGFQAGCIMWEFIRHWNYTNNKLGLKIVNYDNLLFPQYESSFTNTISQDHWKRVQEEAKKRLEENETSEFKAGKSVLAHWQSIVDGNLPFGFTIKED